MEEEKAFMIKFRKCHILHFQLFLSSNVDENQCLNADGLFLLCEKLKLSAFAKSITERVLCGADTVDFYDFKERFVSYLPEIIDVSSGTVDPLLARAQDTARTLGYGDGQSIYLETLLKVFFGKYLWQLYDAAAGELCCSVDFVISEIYIFATDRIIQMRPERTVRFVMVHTLADSTFQKALLNFGSITLSISQIGSLVVSVKLMIDGNSLMIQLTRYETRLLCENTTDLVQLSVVDINGLFERADVERTGRVSVQQFLAQYRLQKRLSAEVLFAFCFLLIIRMGSILLLIRSFLRSISSKLLTRQIRGELQRVILYKVVLHSHLNLITFSTIDSHDLLEYWNKAGLRIDEGIAVLKVISCDKTSRIRNAIECWHASETEGHRGRSEKFCVDPRSRCFIAQFVCIVIVVLCISGEKEIRYD
ncbi:unnamed protein product [Cylicostephanus goldi]|uniref:Uncharacterized protein n=1 Tax=Cylicostephanus goldi TaxID=71465 RepID=A0A3P6Q7F4_CYLGO|nr:unnamed protein product [Cylicostephanus goldi]